MPKKSLLLVIDDPQDDNGAIERTKFLARSMNACVEVYSCLYDELVASERAFDLADLDKAKKSRLQERHKALESIASQFVNAGVATTVKVEWDKPVYQGIVRRALHEQPDLVIRNSHYHTPIRRTLLSNDDWNLIRTCPVPLLVVRGVFQIADAFQVWAAIDPMHDHDKPAQLDDEIVKHGQSLAAATKGECHLVHYFDPAPLQAISAAGVPASVALDEIQAMVRSQHRTALEEFCDRHGIDPDTVGMHMGSARAQLPELMLEKRAHCLVVGAVSRSRLSSVIIGNTAERILDRVPCDVLVIKPPGFETPVREVSRHHLELAAAEPSAS